MLLGRHGEFAAHAATPWHPERAERLAAVFAGVEDSPAAEVMVPFEPAARRDEELEIVHDPSYIERIEDHCLSGGGKLDQDTFAAPGSFDASPAGRQARASTRWNDFVTGRATVPSWR